MQKRMFMKHMLKINGELPLKDLSNSLGKHYVACGLDLTAHEGLHPVRLFIDNSKPCLC